MTHLAQHTYEEIYRQPRCLQGVADTWDQLRTVIDRCFAQPYDLVCFTGCGTSHYLAQSAQFLFASRNATPAIAVPCSELYYHAATYLKGQRVLVVPFTRKSITTEVRMAMDAVHALPQCTTLSITCDEGSAEYNDHMLLSPDAQEQSIVMTGSFSSMLYIAALMSLYLAGDQAGLQELLKLPAQAEAVLRQTDELTKRLAQRKAYSLVAVLGQGAYYGVSSESMNKVKEMSLTHAEAHHTLEYRHGPMSLVEDGTLVAVMTCEGAADGDRALLKEMKGYGAVTCAMGPGADGMDADEALALNGSQSANVVLCAFFGQLLGYHLALGKGLDADAPRHLSQAIVLEK